MRDIGPASTELRRSCDGAATLVICGGGRGETGLEHHVPDWGLAEAGLEHHVPDWVGAAQVWNIMFQTGGLAETGLEHHVPDWGSGREIWNIMFQTGGLAERGLEHHVPDWGLAETNNNSYIINIMTTTMMFPAGP